MNEAIRRYYQLKQKQKEIEQELAELRRQIMDHGTEQGLTEWEAGRYRVKIVAQDRREYDDQKLYVALPDSGVWRLISRADPAKIAGMVKLNVISEQILTDTYTMKKISSLQIDRI